MKNEKLISSWNKIKPNDEAKERMLNSILEQNQQAQNRKEQEYTMSNNRRKKILIPIAACLVAIIAVGGIFGINHNKSYTVTLDNGESIVYYNNGGLSTSSMKIDIAGITRALTKAEVKKLFPNLTGDISASGSFLEESGELFRIEGRTDKAKIIFSKGSHPLTDAIIVGDSNKSTIKGVPVECGLFITDPNSRGEQTAIFYASFKLGDTNAFVELAGDKGEAEALSQRHAELVEQVIDNGELDFSLVWYK